MSKEVLSNAVAFVRDDISAAATSIKLNRSTFPMLTNSDWSWAVIDDGSYTEIVKITGQRGNVLTVARGQQGTLAHAFPAGAVIRASMTPQSLDDLQMNPDFRPSRTLFFGCSNDSNSPQPAVPPITVTKNGNRRIMWARAFSLFKTGTAIENDNGTVYGQFTQQENQITCNCTEDVPAQWKYPEVQYNRIYATPTNVRSLNPNVNTNEFYNESGVKHGNVSIVTSNSAWWNSLAGAGASSVKLFVGWLGGTNANVTIDAAYGFHLSPMKQTGVTKGYGFYQEGTLDYNLFKGRTVQATPNSAPDDTELVSGSASLYVDQATHKLMVRVKYADGTTMKTGEVALV